MVIEENKLGAIAAITNCILDGSSFIGLHESAGMGILCSAEKCKIQLSGMKADAFILVKSGGAAAGNEFDSVSGASVSSSTIVNAVNAALDFWN